MKTKNYQTRTIEIVVLKSSIETSTSDGKTSRNRSSKRLFFVPKYKKDAIKKQQKGEIKEKGRKSDI